MQMNSLLDLNTIIVGEPVAEEEDLDFARGRIRLVRDGNHVSCCVLWGPVGMRNIEFVHDWWHVCFGN